MSKESLVKVTGHNFNFFSTQISYQITHLFDTLFSCSFIKKKSEQAIRLIDVINQVFHNYMPQSMPYNIRYLRSTHSAIALPSNILPNNLPTSLHGFMEKSSSATLNAHRTSAWVVWEFGCLLVYPISALPGPAEA